MIRKKRWIWISLGLAAIFAISAGAAVIFAQESAGEDTRQDEGGVPPTDRPLRPWREALNSWHRQAHRRPQPLERFLRHGVDHKQLLADALDISVEELQEARQDARAAAITGAVDLGIITQEEGDRILAFTALSAAISREELIAQALDIGVLELRTARSEHKKLPALLEQQDLTLREFRENLLAAFQDSVEEAVANSVLSQDQADLILNDPGSALRRLFRGFRWLPPSGD